MTHVPPAEQLWFMDALVSVRVSGREGADGVSVLEFRLSAGDSPPLHLHRTEDEVFVVLEGQVRFRLGAAGAERTAGPGETLLAPKGVPHTYRVQSADGARLLTITAKGDFERFVREMARPAERAERAELPARGGAPTPEMMAKLTETAGRYGIEFVGPPMG